MKKYIYILCVVLVGVFASCSKSETGAEVPQSSQVTLRAVADGGIQTRAAATGVDRYVLEVYTDDAYTTPANILADGTTNKATNATGVFTMILDRTKAYYCLLWADKAGAEVYNTADLKSVVLNTGKTPVEAWFGSTNIEVGTKADLTATLNRAVSKITLLETGKLGAEATLKLDFKQPMSFNVVDGTASATLADRRVTITTTAITGTPAVPVQINTEPIFVLSSVARSVSDFKFQYNDEEEIPVTNVPQQANYNTNIKGHYTTKTILSFNITCDDAWDTPDNDIDKKELVWAKGNLVAKAGGGCEISTTPMATGLYFQFGSLVGWSTTDPLAIAVKPDGCSVSDTWNSNWKGDPTTDVPATGFGDPCRYYLKGGWRLPTREEFNALFGKDETFSETLNWGAAIPDWTKGDSSTLADPFWIKYTDKGLQFTALGWRFTTNGALDYVGRSGSYWSSSGNDPDNTYRLLFTKSEVRPSYTGSRANGYPVRCVRD